MPPKMMMMRWWMDGWWRHYEFRILLTLHIYIVVFSQTGDLSDEWHRSSCLEVEYLVNYRGGVPEEHLTIYRAINT